MNVVTGVGVFLILGFKGRAVGRPTAAIIHRIFV